MERNSKKKKNGLNIMNYWTLEKEKSSCLDLAYVATILA